MEYKTSLVHPTSGQETATRPDETSLDSMSAATKQDITLPDGCEPLPLDPNYKSPGYHLYRYRGTTLNISHLTRGILQQLEQFRGRPSDVIVAGFLKSGTTWLQEIVWHVTHNGEMAGAGGSGRPLESRFPLLHWTGWLNESGKMEKLPPPQKMSDPRFRKTHLPHHLLPESLKTSGAKVLYVSRDARDVCVSFYHFSTMVSIYQYRGTFSEFRDSFMRDAVVFGPYREHVQGYLEHSDTVLCLTYEQMHEDRASVVRKVADFLGVSLADTDVDSIVRKTSFEVMRTNPDTNFWQWDKNGMVSATEEGTFMRKGVVGDWKNYFTEEENEAFVEWRNEAVVSL